MAFSTVPPTAAVPAGGWPATSVALFSRKNALQRSYDAVAAAYAKHYENRLDTETAERELLDRFAEALADAGPCMDLGCGPGYGTRYLHDRGVEISGLDLSSGMVKQARKLHPDIRFEQGDMRAIKARDESLAAVVSLFSLRHIPAEEVQNTLLEFQRVLEPGGALLLAFHTGLRSTSIDHWLDKKVELDMHQHRFLDVIVKMQQAGFREVSIHSRRERPVAAPREGVAWIVAEALPGVPPGRRRGGGLV